MAQINSQAEAGGGSGSETEAAKAAGTDSLNNPGKEQNLAERIKSASTPAELLKLTAELEEPVAAPPEGEKAAGEKTAGTENESEAGAGAAEAAKAEGDGAAAEASEASDAEKTAAEEAQAKAAAEEAEKKKLEEEGDGEKLPERIRLTNFSDVEKLALQLKRTAERAGTKLTLAEAEKRAMAALGVTQSETEAAKTAESDGLPKTAVEVESRLKELVAQRTKAFEEDLDFKAANQLTLQIEALKEHKLTLREQATKTAATEQAKYDEAFTAAEARAASLYDFVKQPESAGFKRMAEIDRQLEANNDPLYNAPDKAVKIAQMAAAELAIAPKSPNAKPAAAKPAVTAKPVVTAPKITPPVASGASRTSTASTQGDQLEKKIKSLRTPADIEEFVSNFGKS